MKKKFVKTERRLSFISSQNETLHSPRITMYGSDSRINSYMDSQTEREKMIQKSAQILFTEGFRQTPRNPVTPKNNFQKMQSSSSFSPFLSRELSSPTIAKMSFLDIKRD